MILFSKGYQLISMKPGFLRRWLGNIGWINLFYSSGGDKWLVISALYMMMSWEQNQLVSMEPGFLRRWLGIFSLISVKIKFYNNLIYF